MLEELRRKGVLVFDWVAYNQPAFISQFWGLQVQDQGTSKVKWRLPSVVQTANFSVCLHMVEGAREISGVSFVRILIPFTRDPPSWPLKGSTSDISTYELEGHTDIQTIAKGQRPKPWRLISHCYKKWWVLEFSWNFCPPLHVDF